MRKLPAFFFCVFPIFLAVCGWCAEPPASEEASRPGAIHDSTGRVAEGRISGKDLRLYMAKKLRIAPLSQVSEIRLTPTKEALERKYNFKTFGSDEKVYSGEPFPCREFECVIRLTDGNVLAGRLAATALYIETASGVRKIVLQSSQTGAEGQNLEDLAYVSRIVFREEAQAPAPGRTRVRFLGQIFGPDATIRALTRKTLVPFELEKTDAPGVYLMPSAFGEQFYLAVQEGDRALVGWPIRDEKTLSAEEKVKEMDLFKATEAALQKEKNFFDARELIAVRVENFEVHALVSLGRSTEKKWADQPWQLAIWRWKFDKDYRDMRYDNQKPLIRIPKLPPDEIPKIHLTRQLWEMSKSPEGVLGIGEALPSAQNP